MKGSDLKTRLEELGFSKAYIADKLGIPAQNVHMWLRAEDVKTGTLERLSEVLGVPISYFYGEAFNATSVTGNNNATATGNNNTVSSSDDRLLDLLVNKDEQLNKAMEQTSRAMEQTAVAMQQTCKSQDQLDEVLKMLMK